MVLSSQLRINKPERGFTKVSQIDCPAVAPASGAVADIGNPAQETRIYRACLFSTRRPEGSEETAPSVCPDEGRHGRCLHRTRFNATATVNSGTDFEIPSRFTVFQRMKRCTIESNLVPLHRCPPWLTSNVLTGLSGNTGSNKMLFDVLSNWNCQTKLTNSCVPKLSRSFRLAKH